MKGRTVEILTVAKENADNDLGIRFMLHSLQTLDGMEYKKERRIIREREYYSDRKMCLQRYDKSTNT